MPYPNPALQFRVLTRSGRLLDIADPRPEDISILDIAHGLSRQFRYGGALRDYTVAQHCYAVAACVEANWPGEPRHGLLDALRHALTHDAAEAFIRDMPTPAKRLMPDYKVVEERLEGVIFSALGIKTDWKAMVHEADLSLCAAEARLFIGNSMPTGDVDELFPKQVLPVNSDLVLADWGPDRAADAFVNLWIDLSSADPSVLRGRWDWRNHAKV